MVDIIPSRFCYFLLPALIHSLLYFQSDCRIVLHKHSGENLILQAVMEEFDLHRENGNITAEFMNREKVGERINIKRLVVWDINQPALFYTSNL